MEAFDSVGLMRELRDGINRDVESMTPEQQVAYIREGAARVRRDLALPEPVPPRAHTALP